MTNILKLQGILPRNTPTSEGFANADSNQSNHCNSNHSILC